MKMLISVEVNTEDKQVAWRVADHIAEYGFAGFDARDFGLTDDDVVCSDPFVESD